MVLQLVSGTRRGSWGEGSGTVGSVLFRKASFSKQQLPREISAAIGEADTTNWLLIQTQRSEFVRASAEPTPGRSWAFPCGFETCTQSAQMCRDGVSFCESAPRSHRMKANAENLGKAPAWNAVGIQGLLPDADPVGVGTITFHFLNVHVKT